jgi:hypothetical protein
MMFRRLLLIGVVLSAWVVNIAASGSSQENAIAIATIAGLVLPFLFKYVPKAGHYMIAIVVAVSALAAVGAMLLSGDLDIEHLQNLNTTALLGLFMTVYGLGQLVWSILTQHPDTQGAVTDPAPVPTPVPPVSAPPDPPAVPVIVIPSADRGA